MKRSNRDQIRRLRQIGSELDATATESSKLRNELSAAIRTSRQPRWPPEPQSDGPDNSASQ
jgi:hypothetical protein